MTALLFQWGPGLFVGELDALTYESESLLGTEPLSFLCPKLKHFAALICMPLCCTKCAVSSWDCCSCSHMWPFHPRPQVQHRRQASSVKGRPNHLIRMQLDEQGILAAGLRQVAVRLSRQTMAASYEPGGMCLSSNRATVDPVTISAVHPKHVGILRLTLRTQVGIETSSPSACWACWRTGAPKPICTRRVTTNALRLPSSSLMRKVQRTDCAS